MLGSRGRTSLLLRALLIIGILYIALTRISFTRSEFPRSIASKYTDVTQDIQSSKQEAIPRKIWQTWHTPAVLLADEDKERIATWHEKNPDYQYELVTDKGAETYVRQHFTAANDGDALIRDVYLNLTDSILRADFLRYLLLLKEGGVYADLDVECREPIDTWVPAAFQEKGVGVVLGIETDRQPVENDVKLYYDHRSHIWGITNWTLMSKSNHPFLRFVAESVARNLVAVARKQGRTLATMELSYKEVIDATGPRAFSEAFLAYASKVSGNVITGMNATMLEEPRLMANDILLLPIRAFSTSEASRSGVEGAAHSYNWPTNVYHWSAGTWKKTHFQRLENETLTVG